MEIYSGGKRFSINEDAVKAMSYEQLQKIFEGQLDWRELAKRLGTKPTPKKRVKKTEEE